MTKRLILASTSKYRRELLERLRVPFTSVAPNVDERALQAALRDVEPVEIARELALARAADVAARFPQSVVIGSDQICVCNREILGKPGTAEAACEQLALLSGKTHRLVTAVCVISEGSQKQCQDVTELKMRSLTPGEIERYVAIDQPLDCAGSYKLECLGISLFETISSADHTAITGLPLSMVAQSLRELGWQVP